MVTEVIQGTTATKSCDRGSCTDHYHLRDPLFINSRTSHQFDVGSERRMSEADARHEKDHANVEKASDNGLNCGPNERGFQRIIKNFTPS